MASEVSFFSMGGYAYFVWFSYGISAIVLLANALLPARKEKKLLAEIAVRERGKSENL
jgi:heme exporter protein D